VPQFSGPRAVPDDQEGGTVSLVGEHWAGEPADDALSHGNPRRPVGYPRHSDRHDLGELARGSRFVHGF
jgi:hypothetical protein